VRQPIAGDVPLSKVIDPLVVEGTLYEKLPAGVVHCYACAHHCKIKPGARGICQVRYNVGGALFVPHGYASAVNCDPIEKKPFFHVHPGSDVLTFGMLGCDIHCSYCQNWDISQALRDADAGGAPARGIASSYNEPLITSEWAMDIFKLGKQAGLSCMYVSNGNATREVLEYLRPYTDAYKIDLKAMRDASYRSLGTPLEHILDSIRRVHQMGFWMEIVTLIVPGFNDSEDELRDAARFITSVSPDIPWHVTAFHADYKMSNTHNTGAPLLVRAAEIGYAEGLHYVYAGNLPGRTATFENTFCPTCHATLIERAGFRVRANHLTPDGACPQCSTPIPGIW
jgi:pyruvate formate lyase activating enzyme